MPSLLHDLLTLTARDLEEVRARFAVVGGLAVAARAVLRTTQDIDLAGQLWDAANGDADRP